MQRPIALSDGYVDIERAQVVRSKTIALTGQEVRLLDHLARHPGRTFTVEELLRDVWGYHHKVASRTVSTTVHRIRRKIEVDPKDPKHLVNTFGVGYRLELAHHSIVVAPVSLGPFVGRESMMEAFDQAIGQAHLVTIVGPPGAGKTRLAMEACRHRHAVFCSLADVSTGVGLENEVSVALGALALKAWPGESAIGASLRRLGEVILVLDNFEGAVEHAPVLMSWLHQAPRARIVVTSRERTRLAGELVLDLGGLAPQDASTLFAMLVGDAAVAEQAATAEVVDALDGLPLAIELAASHARVLGVGGVREQTRTNPLDLPAARGGPSLRGALERSWVLLSEAEQATLSRCALFSAPFDLDAVKAVVETETPIHEVMASLRDRSLFRTDIAPPRFGLYASVRAFADEKLSDLDRSFVLI